MAKQVKCLLWKLEDLSSILGTQEKVERTDSTKLSSALHMCTHTHPSYIYIYKIKIKRWRAIEDNT